MNKLPILAWIASAGALACNNPAPTAPGDEPASTAGAPAALGNQVSVCELAMPVTDDTTDASRSFRQRERDLYAPRELATSYAQHALPCEHKLSGSYGLRVELDVYTQAEGVLPADRDPGRGRAVLLLRADLEPPSGIGVTEAQLRLCGMRLPPAYGYARSEVTQLWVPDETWERGAMPRFRTHARAAGPAAAPQLQLDAFPMLLGIALAEPGAIWPSFEQTPRFACDSERSGSDCFPDHDNDGAPGFSLHVQREGEIADVPYPACGTWHYAGPSADHEQWLASDDAEVTRMFVGMRTALQIFLELDETCDQGSGSAVAEDILTRVLDCDLAEGRHCSAAQATNVDARAASFHVLARDEVPAANFRDSRSFVDESLDRGPSDGGSVSIRRLAEHDSGGCADVRAVLGSEAL